MMAAEQDHMKTLFRTFVSLSFVVCLGASAALAQSAASADLEGVVTDASGAAIPGAALTVTNSETGVGRQSVTNMAGRYRISALPVGRIRAARLQRRLRPRGTQGTGAASRAGGHARCRTAGGRRKSSR